mgnify:CR=1 FL=1
MTWICHVDEKHAEEESLYDMIIGMDLMTSIGIYVDTSTKEVKWEGHAIPLKQHGDLQSKEMVQHIYHISQQPTIITEVEERQSRILDADYSTVDIDEHIDELKHLNLEEKKLLKEMLKRHTELFSGGLGTLNIKPVKLELKPGATPYHARSFPVPKSLEATTKREIDRLESVEVLRKSHNSEWAAPTFVQPKKTGDVRILTDFRKLNDVLVRKPFPLPKISDLLQKLSGFKYITAIDLSMGYYHIPLDEASQKL